MRTAGRSRARVQPRHFTGLSTPVRTGYNRSTTLPNRGHGDRRPNGEGMCPTLIQPELDVARKLVVATRMVARVTPSPRDRSKSWISARDTERTTDLRNEEWAHQKSVTEAGALTVRRVARRHVKTRKCGAVGGRSLTPLQELTENPRELFRTDRLGTPIDACQ